MQLNLNRPPRFKTACNDRRNLLVMLRIHLTCSLRKHHLFYLYFISLPIWSLLLQEPFESPIWSHFPCGLIFRQNISGFRRGFSCTLLFSLRQPLNIPVPVCLRIFEKSDVHQNFYIATCFWQLKKGSCICGTWFIAKHNYAVNIIATIKRHALPNPSWAWI